jgi:uncharacterized SAM-binding protein YcdF (DUF218 family)/glycosyltransferase involved in cell wall biosynthesis
MDHSVFNPIDVDLASMGKPDSEYLTPERGGEDILCFSSIDWDFMWQGHQEIMSSLSREGRRVLFIENTGVRNPRLGDFRRIRNRFVNWKRGLKGFRKEADNLYIFSPLLLPFPYSRLARWLNSQLMLFSLRKWMHAMEFDRPICWTFLPTPLTLELIHQIPHRILIYYCIDSFENSTPAAQRIVKSEQELFSKADLVLVTSRQLYLKASRWNHRVHSFPFGVSLQKFLDCRRSPGETPDELKGLSSPIVGYVGGIHQWVDQDLLVKTARSLKDYSFVMVGPVQTDVSKLEKEPNIYILGQRLHDRLPGYILRFDVCIIPYCITEYTVNVYPTKLSEYHALEKPVVSTPLPEVLNFNQTYPGLVEVGSSGEEFSRKITHAMSKDSSLQRRRRLDAATDNSWVRKIDLIQGLIDKRLKEKATMEKGNWVDRFKAVLDSSRPGGRWIAVLVVLAGLFFYTPLIRVAALPLYVQNSLVPSDAIVVFAGGVGESGKPGERYRQQVFHAVRLYNTGYAPNILFVSSSLATFQETEIMRVLTEAQGVPKQAIITEPNVKNTYEYVKSVARISEDQGWGSIILMTSPHHGRRAVQTFQKNSPELGVQVTSSQPFPRRWEWRRVRLHEINKVLREYAALFYYSMKGWI